MQTLHGTHVSEQAESEAYKLQSYSHIAYLSYMLQSLNGALHDVNDIYGKLR